jgi:DNA-directed RNA polymerase subunit RPC12/RpoP
VGAPWKLWVRRSDGVWLTRDYADYRSAWPVFIKQLKTPGTDATIVSKRTFYAPPGEYRKVKVRLARAIVNSATGELTTHRVEERWRDTFDWDRIDPRHEWCGRCRRPVVFQPLFSDHHALRRFPALTEDDNIRCPICGIRRVAQPPRNQMVRC